MSEPKRGHPRLDEFYTEFQLRQDTARFVSKVSALYLPSTLERLLQEGRRTSRRAAAFALGFVGTYDSNAPLGKALHDEDRVVRLAAENSMRSIWSNAGSAEQRHELAVIMRCNLARNYREAMARSTNLIAKAPWFAEAWNQRAIGYFGLEQYSKSIEDCKHALDINPYHFGAAAGMGQCYLYLQRPREALESFRHALSLNPDLEGVRASVSRLERALEKGT